MQPDIALLHAPVADRAGNVAIHPPLLEGVWGALAARRGAIVTVERIVDDIRPWSHLVRIPAHRVLAVVETPFGAHPGGLYTGSLPAEGYGEDYEFWVGVRAATRRDDYDDWIREWVLDVETQEQYLAKVGAANLDALRAKSDPDSWRSDEASYLPDLDAPPNAWEQAAAMAARHLAGARRRARRRRGTRRRRCGEPRSVARRAAPRARAARTPRSLRRSGCGTTRPCRLTRSC